jgi:hypothetical protein
MRHSRDKALRGRRRWNTGEELAACLRANGLTRADLDALVGLDVAAARAEAARRGMIVRVLTPFGAMTADLRTNRANVATRRGVVVEVRGMG